MADILSLLSGPAEARHWQRSGMASCCRLACAALAQGRSSVILVRDREEYTAARALLTLFSPSLSLADMAPDVPAWKLPFAALPAGLLLRRDRDSWAGRLAALYGLAQGGPRCLILSTEALLLRHVPRDFFAEHTLDLTRGSDYPPELILDQAVEWGYERVPLVTRPGQMARRGDIFDIFPSGYPRPVRMEFFGDTLEELRLFDAESQRSLQGLDELTLLPALPFVLDAQGLAAARKRMDALFAGARISENDCYTFKKTLDAGGLGLLPGVVHEKASTIADWLPEEPLWFLPGQADCDAALHGTAMQLRDQLEEDDAPLPQPSALCLCGSLQDLPWEKARRFYLEPLVMGVDAVGDDVQERPLHAFTDLFPVPGAADRPWQHLSAGLKEWQNRRRQVVLSFSSQRSRAKFLKLAEQEGITPALRYAPEQRGLFALVSPWRSGAELVWDDVLVLGEDILYPRAEKKARASSRAFKGLDSFDDLKAGDLLVHRDYGIGRFAGLHHLVQGGQGNDFLLVEYSGQDRLYVPVDRLGLIQRFKGGEGAEPALDRLGGASWSSGKEKVRKAIEKIAADLVEMYAYRKVAKGFRYDPPGELYHEFEATFGFEETPDQARAIEDVLADMDKSEPMDRLVCGDVGFGKTEVAIRAAFKAATDGKQVAVLVPTTILALQHYRSFVHRLRDFPVKVEYLNRTKSSKETSRILSELAEGRIDILIGTHKILGKQVKFHDLGLLIIDEEQKFGVAAKEKLTQMSVNVDTLTLTATPIPRTLQFSLMGSRDLSVISTPPPNRQPIITESHLFSEEIIRDAVNAELDRGGQVYFVHNRVEDLMTLQGMVTRLCPRARVGIGHGKMPAEQLEKLIMDFIYGEFDVLISTTIVENGIDIPNANTIIVNNAQNFGLSDLHQLRGRVGRGSQRGYCYLLSPGDELLTPDARRRLRAIEEFSDLGSGFNIAMQDLDIRGAGNLLGAEQSGFIADIGFETYQKIMQEAIAELRSEGLEMPGMSDAEQGVVDKMSYISDSVIEIDVEAELPDSYVQQPAEKLRLYRELDTARNEEMLKSFEAKLIDRFGPLPRPAAELLNVVRLRWEAVRLGMERVKVKNGLMIVHFVGDDDSPYYKSDTFMELLRKVTQRPDRFVLKQHNNRLAMTVRGIKDVAAGYEVLKSL